MPITISLPLDLPDVRVFATQVLPDATLLIEVESTLRTTQCHRCGQEIDRFHGFDRPIRLRHLPVFGRPVVVEIRPSATCHFQKSTARNVRSRVHCSHTIFRIE